MAINFFNSLAVDTDVLYVDTINDKVGIGTSSPSGKLHVGSSADQTTVLKIEATNTAGAPAATTELRMIGYESRGQGVFFEDTSNSGEEWFAGLNYASSWDTYSIGYDASGGQAEYVANAILTAVGSTGNVGIGTTSPSQKLDVVGSIEVSDGIYIGGTGSANKFDDYEEGAFTPAFSGSSGLAITHDTQVGRYVKVGRLVNVFIELGSDAVTYASGNLEITGLPFTADDLDGAAFPGLNYSFQTSLADYTFVILENNSKINIYQRNSTSQYPANQLGTGTNANRLRLVATYITAT